MANPVWLLPILAVAALFRLYQIDLPDIWIDEANLILTAREPLPELLGQLRHDSSPPFYYLLVRAWGALFGDGAFALRMLSCTTGLLLVAATWWIGRHWLSPAAGLWAAGYLAVSPSQSFYSQQVRMYALLALLALLSTAFLVRFCARGERRDFAIWIGSALLALYTHNFAFHLLVAQLVIIVLSGQLLERKSSWLLAAACIALLYAPWLPTLWLQLENRDHYAWFVPRWEAWGVTGALIRSARSLSPSSEFIAYAGLNPPVRWWGAGTWGALILAALGASVALRRVGEQGAARMLWPLILVVSPVASAILLSLLATPHFVAGRVDQMMLPAYALLVGAGLSRVRPAWAGGLLAAGIFLLAVVSRLALYDYYTSDSLDGGEQALARRIEEVWRPGDVILCTSLSRAPAAYYLSRTPIEASFLSFPRGAAVHLGAQNDRRLLADPVALTREAAAVLEQARSLAGEEGRLFVIWVKSRVNIPLRHEALVSQGFEPLAELGRFRQYGSGLEVEGRLYDPQ